MCLKFLRHPSSTPASGDQSGPTLGRPRDSKPKTVAGHPPAGETTTSPAASRRSNGPVPNRHCGNNTPEPATTSIRAAPPRGQHRATAQPLLAHAPSAPEVAEPQASGVHRHAYLAASPVLHRAPQRVRDRARNQPAKAHPNRCPPRRAEAPDRYGRMPPPVRAHPPRPTRAQKLAACCLHSSRAVSHHAASFGIAVGRSRSKIGRGRGEKDYGGASDASPKDWGHNARHH